MFILNFIKELLQRVRRGFLWYLQSLHISAEAWDTHQSQIVSFEDALEVTVDGHKFCGEAGVGSDGNAVFAGHGNHGISIVRVELRNLVKWDLVLTPIAIIQSNYFQNN